MMISAPSFSVIGSVSSLAAPSSRFSMIPATSPATDQAHALGIPVFMKEDLVPIIGDENMIQEMPEEFNKVLEVQRSWQK